MALARLSRTLSKGQNRKLRATATRLRATPYVVHLGYQRATLGPPNTRYPGVPVGLMCDALRLVNRPDLGWRRKMTTNLFVVACCLLPPQHSDVPTYRKGP